MQNPHGSMGNVVHALSVGGGLGSIMDAVAAMVRIVGFIVGRCGLKFVKMEEWDA